MNCEQRVYDEKGFVFTSDSFGYKRNLNKELFEIDT